MNVKKVLVTPKMAKEILENNPKNRNVNHVRIHQYAREMQLGNWLEDTGELIKISVTGKLIDGQHRLYAVIKANISVNFHIATGLSDNVFKAIDTGKPRSASDIFKISGIKNSANVSSIIQLYNTMYNNKISNKKNSSFNVLRPQELLDAYYEQAQYWQDIHLFGDRMYHKFQKIWLKTEISVFTAIFDNVSAIKSREFIRQICEGINVSNNGIILLRNHLISDKMSNKTKMTSVHRRALIIKCWNAFYSGKEMKVLRYTQELESYPDIIGLN